MTPSKLIWIDEQNMEYKENDKKTVLIARFLNFNY